ncbi:MAG: caspase family protein [Pseudomonadota bacterium]
MRFLVLAAAALTFLASASHAEERRIALLIGNEAYPDVVGRLDNPHEDVDGIAVALTRARFAPDDIIVVKDGSQQAMLQGLAEFTARLKSAGGEGVGFFYYSGHGASAESAGQRENYLVPSDAAVESAEQLPLLGVPLTGVIKSLSSIEARSIFIISDACRNTLPLTSGNKALGGAGDKGFSPVPMRPGLFIAYATADGATAPDDGAFASAIATHIQTPRQVASRAFELALRDVVQTRENSSLPFVSPGLTEDFCFVSCPEDEPVQTKGPGSANDQELTDWRTAVQADTKEAYLDFARRYPDTFLGGEARAMAVLRPTEAERAAARQVSGDAGGDSVERTLQALEDLTASLEGLARLGGVIDNPESVTDFYNNAQVYERRGDSLNARRMYERAIASGADAVDIHFAYVATLKAQEGLIGAREIYADLSRRNQGTAAAQLVHATVLPGEARRTKLETIASETADFGPVYFELARLYSLDRLGQQTNADKLAEKKWLSAFRDADTAGDLQKWFLDDSLLADWRADADRRWAAYASAADVAPVTFSAMYSNSGWTINATPTEAAVSLMYKTAATGTFQETAYWGRQDPRTGKPAPMTFFDLPLGASAQTVEVKYVDVNGVEQGPFSYAFDPAVRFVESSREILAITRNAWISGRNYDGRTLVYFTHLLTHSCGLDKIEYTFSGGTPDKVWPLPACDPLNPGAIASDAEIYTELDDRPASALVRLTYKDGSQSDLVEIPLRY